MRKLLNSCNYPYTVTIVYYVCCCTATPNITAQPQSGVFKNNNRNVMVFEVVATGMGPISYQWEKYQSFSNSWIRPSSRVVSVTSSKLIFSLITEEDEGTYRCIVTNDDGSVVSDSVNVTVYGELNDLLLNINSVAAICTLLLKHCRLFLPFAVC